MPRRLRPTVRIEEGRKVLRVAGIIQSMETGPDNRPDLWDALVPRAPAVRRALLLGLGGGTVASVILRRFPSAAITGVDDDVRMLALAREAFDLGRHDNVRMVTADAFDFVETDEGPYELICVDLFRGLRMPPRVLSERFLLALRRLARPGATVTFNLMHTRDIARRVSRLNRILPVRFLLEIGGNVVAHCAPAPPPGAPRPVSAPRGRRGGGARAGS